MLSGDRQVSVGEKGPFHSMQAEFSRWFERVDVLCPQPDRPPTVSVIHDNVHFHPAPCGRLGMVGWLARRGAELVAEHGHGLAVSHDYGTFYNGRAAARLAQRSGIPWVSEIHHVPGYPVAATGRERLERALTRLFVRWARGRVRAFRVVNATEMPALLESWGVPRERIAVLHSLYMDLETFRPPDPAKGPVPEPEQDVVFVGRMVQNKGLERIVDALAELRDGGCATSALLLGRGPRRAAVEARVRERRLDDLVRFLDWVEEPRDLAEIYRRSRVVVCASTCEGGPRFTVEAMACGVPAVSTPVGIMGEVLEDGLNGWRAGFDVASLAAALGRTLADEDERRAMGRRARAVAERFEYRRVLGEYAQGLGRLAGEELRRT